MADPFLGEIQVFAGTWEPMGWMLCDGRELDITMYSALYSLLGDTYGPASPNKFRLPDFRGRIPVNQGQRDGVNYSLGNKGGVETVTLTPNQVAQHTHTVHAQSSSGSTTAPTGGVWAMSGKNQFSGNAPAASMSGAALQSAGADQLQAHDNMMPYLPLKFIICVDGGLYPVPD